MVATRHSLPSAHSTSAHSAALAEGGPDDVSLGSQHLNDDADRDNIDNLRLKAALRKLQIDGTDALKGDLPASRKADRSSTTVYHYRGAAYEVKGDEPVEWIDAQPRRRKSDSARCSMAESSHQIRSTKRKRDDHDALDVREALHGLRRRKSHRNGHRRVLRPVELGGDRITQDANGYIVYDQTRIGGDDDRKHIEEAREIAKRKGYTVSPIPQIEVGRYQRERLRQSVVEMSKLNERMAGVLMTYRRCRRMSSHTIDKDVTKAGAQKQRLVEEETSGTQSGERERSVTQQPTPTSTARSAPSIDMQEAEIEGQRLPDQSLTQPPPSSPPPPLRPHATTPRPASPSYDQILRDTDAQLAMPNPALTDLPMPSTNRGGQTLRWSLDTSKLQDKERAEGAIHSSRLPGESKQARRRRVKRELGLLRSWQDVRTEANGEDGIGSA